MILRAFTFIGALLFSGCTFSGELADSEKNTIKKCTDYRDGSFFFFRTSSVSNIRAGVGVPSTFDIVDNDGVSRTLSSEMETYLKCVTVGSSELNASGVLEADFNQTLR